MLQEVITYIIVFSAIIYTVYESIKFFIPKKTKSGHMCSGTCSGCDLKNKTSLDFRISEYKF